MITKDIVMESTTDQMGVKYDTLSIPISLEGYLPGSGADQRTCVFSSTDSITTRGTGGSGRKEIERV